MIQLTYNQLYFFYPNGHCHSIHKINRKLDNTDYNLKLKCKIKNQYRTKQMFVQTNSVKIDITTKL